MLVLKDDILKAMTTNILKLLIILLVLFTMQTDTIADRRFEIAAFAGGCFWCMEPAFEKLNGVTEVISGYFEENLGT